MRAMGAAARGRSGTGFGDGRRRRYGVRIAGEL